MNNLQVFQNNEFGQVRTVMIGNKVHFVASDVAEALGYSNPRKAIIDHCKGVTKRDILTNGGNQTMSIIPEGDIYRLIVRSKLESAQKFETWVFDDVLPSIRTKGMYATDELLDNPDLLIKVATQLKEEREARKQAEQVINKQQQVIGELKPKADYTDAILSSKGLVTITQIAKDYGMSGNKMNDTLHTFGVQYKQSGQWLLYSKHHGMGYTHSETVPITRTNGMPDVKMNTKWTQKGRLFLYELLKNNGILPTIEMR